MPEPFVPLATWLRPASRAETIEPYAVPESPRDEPSDESPEEIAALLRLFRAALAEALESEPCDRAALERMRRHADALLARLAQ